jgi:hypothetical protein
LIGRATVISGGGTEGVSSSIMQAESKDTQPPNLKLNPNVLFKRLGDQMVLFNLDTDHFYELSGSAARFWELLHAGHDSVKAGEQMLAEFDVDLVQLTREIEALLASLRSEGLVSSDE